MNGLLTRTSPGVRSSVVRTVSPRPTLREQESTGRFSVLASVKCLLHICICLVWVVLWMLNMLVTKLRHRTLATQLQRVGLLGRQVSRCPVVSGLLCTE